MREFDEYSIDAVLPVSVEDCGKCGVWWSGVTNHGEEHRATLERFTYGKKFLKESEAAPERVQGLTTSKVVMTL